MSAWQAYKVMLLGLAVPTAAVIVELGSALVAPKQFVAGSEQATYASGVVASSTTADRARFSFASEPPSTGQPPANVPPQIMPLPATLSPLPAAPKPPADEPAAPAATANAPNDGVPQEAPAVETIPADG
jgi:hypothetical protein